MDQQIFSDGIGQITVIGGAVRLDLVAYSATEKDAKGQPVAAFCQRVVMSVDGFMHAAAKVQEAAQAISKLAQRPRDGQPVEPTVPPAVAAPEEPAPPKRPFP
jgi:hypothetical protein